MQRLLIRQFAHWVGMVLLALACVVPAARAQAVDWGQALGQNQRGLGNVQVVVDAQSNAYICGSFSDLLVLNAFTLYAPDSINPGALDVFVAKLDPNGICQWAERAGGQGGVGGNTGYDRADGIVLDAAGNVLVTGGFDSYSASFGSHTLFNAGPRTDLFVAKLNGATGQWLWARRAGGDSYDGGSAIKVDAVGDAYVLGSFGSTACQVGTVTLTRQTSSDLLIAKLNGVTGQWLWASRAGLGLGRPADLALDGQGRVVVTGGFLHPVADFGADTLIAYSAGSGTNYVANEQCFVARLSTSTGSWQWATQGGDSNRQYGGAHGSAVTVDGQGRITVAGNIHGCHNVRFGGTTLTNQSAAAPINGRLKSDIFVAQLDSTGQWLSASAVGGSGEERVQGIALEPGGSFCIGGTFDSPSFSVGTSGLQSTSRSIYMARVDAAGTWLDGSTVGNGGNAYLTGVATDVLGRRYVGGIFQATTFQLGAATLTNIPNGTTGFVARLGAGPLAASTEQRAMPAGLVVWPNPTTGTVQISGPAPGQRVQLVDVQGRCVVEGQMPTGGPLMLTRPASLAAGLYVVRVPGTRLTRRLVVE